MGNHTGTRFLLPLFSSCHSRRRPLDLLRGAHPQRWFEQVDRPPGRREAGRSNSVKVRCLATPMMAATKSCLALRAIASCASNSLHGLPEETDIEVGIGR